MDLPYRMYDADNHLYETDDAFTRHLPDERRRDLYWVTDERGHRHIMMGGHVWNYVPNPTFDPISVAGALTDMFLGEKSKAEVITDGYKVVEPLALHPEYQERGKRLTQLDVQNIEGCLLFPTLASGIEERVRRGHPAAHRHSLGLQPLAPRRVDVQQRGPDVRRPHLLAGRCGRGPGHAGLGHRAGLPGDRPPLRPGPHGHGVHFAGEARFDRFWSRCEEAGVLVGVHAGPVSYTKYTGDWTGNFEYHAFSRSAFEHIALHGRAISDFFTAMVCDGALTRHPNLKVVSVENGGDWIPSLVDKMKIYYHRYPGSFPEDPVDAFERCVWVSPFWEDDISHIARYLPIERILAGSDYPHAEGLAEPTDFRRLSGTSTTPIPG